MTGSIESCVLLSNHKRSGPLALAHERLDCTGGGDAVDIELAGADHPIDVDEARSWRPLAASSSGESLSPSRTQDE